GRQLRSGRNDARRQAQFGVQLGIRMSVELGRKFGSRQEEDPFRPTLYTNYLTPSFVQGREELQVQELVSQASVEALVETVLPRRARLDEQGPYSTGRQEAPGGVGDELRSGIATDEPRRPMCQRRFGLG